MARALFEASLVTSDVGLSQGPPSAGHPLGLITSVKTGHRPQSRIARSGGRPANLSSWWTDLHPRLPGVAGTWVTDLSDAGSCLILLCLLSFIHSFH